MTRTPPTLIEVARVKLSDTEWEIHLAYDHDELGIGGIAGTFILNTEHIADILSNGRYWELSITEDRREGRRT